MSSRTWVTALPVTTLFMICATSSEESPSWRALSLGDIDLEHLPGLVPVVDDIADVRVAVEHAGQAHGVLADLVDLRSADPVLDRPSHRRPHLQRLHVGADADVVLAQAIAQACGDALAGLQVLGDDHQLAIEVVLQLLVQRQVKADRAFADVGAPVVDVLVVLQRRFQAVHHRPGLVDAAVLRQVEVDQQFRTVGRREELVLDELHQEQRHAEQQRGEEDGRPAPAHRQVQQAVETLGDAALLLLRLVLESLRQDVHGDHRGEQHRDDPRQQQRHSDHCEQGEGVLASGAGVEPDGYRSRPPSPGVPVSIGKAVEV